MRIGRWFLFVYECSLSDRTKQQQKKERIVGFVRVSWLCSHAEFRWAFNTLCSIADNIDFQSGIQWQHTSHEYSPSPDVMFLVFCVCEKTENKSSFSVENYVWKKRDYDARYTQSQWTCNINQKDKALLFTKRYSSRVVTFCGCMW